MIIRDPYADDDGLPDEPTPSDGAIVVLAICFGVAVAVTVALWLLVLLEWSAATQ